VAEGAIHHGVEEGEPGRPLTLGHQELPDRRAQARADPPLRHLHKPGDRLMN